MAILITIIVVVVLAAAATAAWWSSKRRLRASFGPELDTVAQNYGSTRQVDRELRRRKKEHDALRLTPISAEDQAYYATTWEHLQGEFLDDPSLSLSSAEKLVATVLKARGYPGDDEEEQLALLSVEHAGALADYRAAQQVNRRAVEDPTTIPTEELRQAILSYYTLFNELIADPGAQADAPTATEGAVSSRTTDSQEATR